MAEATEASDRVIGFAGSFTTQPIGDLVASMGHTVVHADYNQIFTTCLDPASAFEGESVSHLVVLWRIEDVFENDMVALLNGEAEAAVRLVDQSIELARLVCGVPNAHGIPVTLGLPPTPVGLGIDPIDTSTSTVVSPVVAEIRKAVIAEAEKESAVRLIDHGRLVDVIGGNASHDHRNQLLYRQPYRTKLNQLLAAELDRVIESVSVAAPKVLVLDCDGTLWDGIVGEDGISGIAIGDTFPGSAFREFQLAVKQLERRGIMLAIASKNEAESVDEVFEKRPEMVLQHNDIAAWRVNWTNKSQNIREIADELNIGLDSVVFVDDSNFEVEEVRTALPMVRVLQVPEDPEDLPALLSESGLFRNLTATNEDRNRTQMMLTERKRDAAADTAMSHEDFLASLDLSVVIDTDNEESLGRITQLINKTNQFNLTTVRRTEADVLALMQSDKHRVYSASVTDRFGSYGLVGIAIVDATDSSTHEIDSLMMSCRVLRRGIESTIIHHVCNEAANAGATNVLGRFIPTAKNAQVAPLYPDHGFDATDSEGVFIRQLPYIEAAPSHIEISYG